MYFSIGGLSLSFALFYVTQKIWTSTSKNSKRSFNVFSHTTAKLFSIFTIVGFVTSLYFVNIDLSLKHFDYMSENTSALENWIQKQKKAELFITPFNRSYTAALNDIRSESATSFLNHHDSWDNFSCDQFKKQSNPVVLKVWGPYIDSYLCQDQPSQLAFLDNYQYQGQEFVLWYPKNKEQIKLLQKSFTDVFSPNTLVDHYNEILKKELLFFWLGGLLIAFATLFFYFRNLKQSLSTLVPYFFAVMVVIIFHSTTSTPLSFISALALIMLLGLSLDYGAFASLKTHCQSTISALNTAAMTSVLGFIPLLFCQHPVLAHLGWTLLCGLVGIFLGTHVLLRFQKAQ